jgi:hypothetical protein
MYKEYTVASQSYINEDRNFKNNNAVTKRLSLYSLPLSEHITGISSQKMNEENIREFPSFSLGVEFEQASSPTTHEFNKVSSPHSQHASLTKDSPSTVYERCPSKTKGTDIHSMKSECYQRDMVQGK